VSFGAKLLITGIVHKRKLEPLKYL